MLPYSLQATSKSGAWSSKIKFFRGQLEGLGLGLTAWELPSPKSGASVSRLARGILIWPLGIISILTKSP